MDDSKTSVPRRFKNNLRLRLASFLNIAVMGCIVSDSFGFEPETNFRVRIGPSSAVIERYVGAGGDVVIPELLGGQPVSGIASGAFQWSAQLTSVSIPDTVAEIGDGAFQGCSRLQKIQIGEFNEHFASLDGVLFTKDRSILLTCPEGKTDEYTVPDTVWSIADRAFSSCTKLTQVTLDDRLQSVGFLAFAGCSGLSQITLGKQLTTFQIYSIRGCTRLKAIKVAPENPAFMDVEGVLFDKSGNQLVAYPAGSTGPYVVPDSVLSIGDFAFQDTPDMTALTMGDQVSHIGFGAFSDCVGLTQVRLSENLGAIEGLTFAGCSALSHIVIPKSVTRIDSNAFQECVRLEQIQIPDGVVFVGDNVFYGCAKLGEVRLGNGLTEIRVSTFEQCPSLSKIRLGSAVKSIEAFSFYGLSALDTLEVDPANPDYSSLDGVLFNKGGSKLLVYPAGRPGPYTIPDKVTSVAYDAFAGCSGLSQLTIGNGLHSIESQTFEDCKNLTHVTVGNRVTSIQTSAFSDCPRLTSITLPEGLKTIGALAFLRCVSLRHITIPNGVTDIGSGAFDGCVQLSSVELPARLTSIEDRVFLDCASLAAITIPESVTFIGAIAFENCTNLTQITIPPSVAIIGPAPFNGCTGLSSIDVDPLNPNFISVDGVLMDKAQSRVVEYPTGKTGAWSIPEGVSAIEMGAMSGSRGLTKISIPTSLTTIAPGEFRGCSSLQAIEVASSNPEYSNLNGVLFNKEATVLLAYPPGRMGSYVLPQGVTQIGESAFEQCLNLTHITLPGSLVSLARDSFFNCGSILELSIPEALTEIGDFALKGCANLLRVDVDSRNPAYSSVDGVLFNKGGTILVHYPAGKVGKQYTIPDGVLSIGNEAFFDVRSLTSVQVPKSVVRFGWHSFSQCSALTSAFFAGDVPSYDSSPFNECPFVTAFHYPSATGFDSGIGFTPSAVWTPLANYNEWAGAVGLTTTYPSASGPDSDADGDGLTNGSEWIAGTDPTDSNSVPALELFPVMASLTDGDRKTIAVNQRALYFRSVPGRYYGLQTAPAMDGHWALIKVRSATTTQIRFAIEKTLTTAFYRVVLLQD